MSKDDSSPLTRDIAPFGVRMPSDLKDRVQASAKANNRSMNAEIVAALEEKYPPTVIHQRAVRNAITMIIKAPAHMRQRLANSMVEVVRETAGDQYADLYGRMMLAATQLAEEHEKEGSTMSDADIEFVLANMQRQWSASPDD